MSSAGGRKSIFARQIAAEKLKEVNAPLHGAAVSKSRGPILPAETSMDTDLSPESQDRKYAGRLSSASVSAVYTNIFCGISVLVSTSSHSADTLIQSILQLILDRILAGVRHLAQGFIQVDSGHWSSTPEPSFWLVINQCNQ